MKVHPVNISQNMMRDLLSQEVMACFVVGIVDRLDLVELEPYFINKRERKQELKLMLSLLFMGYTQGIYSSRELEQATYEKKAFRFITAYTHPSSKLISTFRKQFIAELEELCVQILLIARSMGLVAEGTENLDVKTLRKRLHREVRDFLVRAEEADAKDYWENKKVEPIYQGEVRKVKKSLEKTITEGLDDSPNTFTFLSKSGVAKILKPKELNTKSSKRFYDRAKNIATKILSIKIPYEKAKQHAERYKYRYVTIFLVSILALAVSRLYLSPSNQYTGKDELYTGPLSLPKEEFTSVKGIEKISRPVAEAPAITQELSTTTDQQPDSKRKLVEDEKRLVLPPTETKKIELAKAELKDTGSAKEADQLDAVEPSVRDLSVSISEGDPVSGEIQADNSASSNEEESGKVELSSELEPGTPVAVAENPAIRSAPKKENGEEINKEEWLLKRNPEHYVLQLLGTSYEKNLLKFINQKKLVEDASYYKSKYKGKDWWVLLYGEFSTRNDAVNAIKMLSRDLKIGDAWPRKIEHIQADIRAQK